MDSHVLFLNILSGLRDLLLHVYIYMCAKFAAQEICTHVQLRKHGEVVSVVDESV